MYVRLSRLRFFNLIKLGNIFFLDPAMPNGNCLLISTSLVIVLRDNSLVHELRAMAAIELLYM